MPLSVFFSLSSNTFTSFNIVLLLLLLLQKPFEFFFYSFFVLVPAYFLALYFIWYRNLFRFHYQFSFTIDGGKKEKCCENENKYLDSDRPFRCISFAAPSISLVNILPSTAISLHCIVTIQLFRRRAFVCVCVLWKRKANRDRIFSNVRSIFFSCIAFFHFTFSLHQEKYFFFSCFVLNNHYLGTWFAHKNAIFIHFCMLFLLMLLSLLMSYWDRFKY